MKKLFTTILLSCLICSASAQIIHVPADQSTIQAGINVASSGDTVLVAQGTYYENINFYGKAITVASNFIMEGDTSHINNTIINGSQPGNPDFASVVSFTTGEDTTSIISGFTITGGTGLLDASIPARIGGGIVCLNAGAKIIHNKIIANEVDHQTAAIGAGICCTMYLQSQWIVIEHNVIADNYSHAVNVIAQGGGIYIGENTGNNIELNARVYDNIIEKNYCYGEVYRADGGGIRIEGSDGVKMMLYFYNNIVRNNSIRSKWTRGAGLCGIRAGADIVNNDFSGNYIDTNSINFRGAAIVFKYPYHGVNIINNQFLNNVSPIICESGTAAVNIFDGYDETEVVIESNIFSDNMGNIGGALYSRKTYNILISNNLFMNNTSYVGGGLRFYQPASKENRDHQPQIVNNTFYNNYAEYGGAMGFKCEINTPVLFNNILWGNQSPNYNDIYHDNFGTETLFVSYCNVDENEIYGLWYGNANINEDPMFVGSGDFPYQINDYSPCIDAGTPDTTGLNLPELDLAGEVRIDNGRIDMGAYEWNMLVGVDEFEVQKSKSEVLVYPNPFIISTTIEYELPQPSTVQVTVYNHLGERVAEIAEQRQPKGKHQLTRSFENLPSGIYYCVLKIDKETKTTKMIKMK